ncbi:TlpA family protein disulfide reductase [Pedobacter sp.]
MKTFTVALLFIGLINHTHAQEIKALKAGDTVPDVMLDSILNYSESQARLSDFKDKVIILDFWATWCGPCITALPKLDSLQKVFKNKIIIIPVTNEKKQLVETFFRERPYFNDFSMPLVYSDKNLRALFQPRGLPYEVIIKNGRVIAVTNAYEINANNIGKIIDDTSLNIFQRKNIAWKNGFDNRGLYLDDEGTASLIQQKLITKSVEGYRRFSTTQNWETKLEDRTTPTRIYGQNMPLNAIIWHAWTRESTYDYHRIRYNVKNMTPYTNSGLKGEIMEEWKRNNWFCYDYIVPLNSRKNVIEVFKEDIQSLFNIKVTYKSELTNCLVLVAVDSSKFKSKNEKPFIDMNAKNWIMRHVPVMSFLDALRNNRLSKELDYPFVDETNYKSPIDLTIRSGLNSYETLRADLQNQGFDLLKVKRKVMILTISDEKNGQ